MYSVKSLRIQGLVVILLYSFMLPILSVSASSVPREYGVLKLYKTPVTYDLNTSVSIGDDYGGGKTSGYRIEAVLEVEPVWSDQETDFLLKFHLESARVWVQGARGAAPAPWAAGGAFFARLTHGAVQAAYLDRRDPLDLLNYKKSIISLFQFRAIDGETKETDISGTCDVLYESTSLTTIHKTKSGCGESEAEKWWRRSTYWLSDALDALRGARAAERVALGGGGAELAARAEHELRLRRAAPRPAPPHARLDHALRDLPDHLTPAALTLEPDSQSSEEVEELPSALSALRALLAGGEEGEDGAGAGGELAAAHAALRALPALAAADAPQLLRALRDGANHALLPALCRLLGLAGAAPAHAAAAEHLQLAAPDPPRALALHYLAGAALAERPAPAARLALLQLAQTARARFVADAATLAAAAQTRRADAEAVRHVRDILTKALSRCKDDECRIVRLHALGNLGLADSAEALLSHAERGARGVALAALDALESLGGALDGAQLARLLRVAARGGRALELRGAALDAWLRRAPAARLAGAARALRRAPAELRRVFWQRAQQLAAGSQRVRDALNALDAEDRSWHARANAGTSHVLSRATGWRLGARPARLEAAQLAAAGLLRRGVVALRSQAPASDEEEEELAVEVWTRGLEAVAGGGEGAREELEEGGEDGEDGGGVRGGLRLRVGGVHAPGRLLFDGQAELLGHIWAGAGSAATPVLRAARARALHAGRAPLLSGATLHYRAGELTLFAVDAQAQVSLWSRSARAELELRVAAAARTAAGVAAPAGAARLQARAAGGAAPRMQLTAHLDFYDGVALCVRAHLADHEHSRNASSAVRAGAAGARRGRTLRLARAGRTLALGAQNDRTCRDLAHADA